MKQKRVLDSFALLADCFAVMTAQQHKAAVVTGDPEFKTIEHLVTVEWLR